MKEKICRLCLQTISNNNCQAVDESLLNSLKLDLKISEENVMCIECANGLRLFSNFTPGRYMEDETTTDSEPLTEAKIKCCFCTKTRGREDLISLRISKGNKYLVNVLEQYIAEMNLKNTKEFLTCDTCLESLERVSSVILKCVEVEEKISKYIELEGTDDKGQVELKKVQRFMFRPILKSEIESVGVNELEDGSDQVLDESTTLVEAEIKCEKEIRNTELIIKMEEDDITSEQGDCDIPDVKSEQQSDCDGFQEPSNENGTPNDPLRISVVISETRKSEDVVKQHPLIHTFLSQIDTFKCELCSYESKLKSYLKRHLLTHKTPSEMKMIKCALCPYEAKRNSNLKAHLLIHKSPSEIKMFKCGLCPYEARQKIYLKRHILTHKSSSEINMFKCELCSYEAKQKYYLKTHLLTHKTPSEIKMIKCALCPYEAKRNCNLKAHLLTHKSPSEIKMFKCETCSYETKLKWSLRQHLLIHKSPSEIKMFKCALCPYEARLKIHLKRHILTHKSYSEINMFKCELCSYEGRQERNLKKHLLTHKCPSR